MDVTAIKRVGVIGGVRIPFCRNNTVYADIGNFGMSVKTLGSLVERYGLHGVELGEVAFGAVIKHASEWNLAREATLSSGLAPTTPGITTARACGTGLDNAIIIANKIATGQIEAGIGGGSDTTSDVPIVYGRALQQRLLAVNRARQPLDKAKAALKGFSFGELAPSFPGVTEPRTGKSMGDHCEQMAREWKISREDQDRLAWESHQKAAAAYERGFFKDLVVPFRGLDRDNILRPDTTLEKLASLKPAFDKTSGHGTLTAGNSTPLSDGASAVLLSSEAWAQ
ncbi:MAG: acetyl-CoA C-acyltransferase, partial [Dokdonella sp.]